MSTFDCSSAEPITVPRPPVPGSPTFGRPDSRLDWNLLAPMSTRPLKLLKVASASRPTATASPAPTFAVIVPSLPMLSRSRRPAGVPFCVFDDVALGDANPVNEAVALASTTFQVSVLAAAPFANAGDVNWIGAIGPGVAVPPPVDPVPGVIDWRTPLLSNASVPEETTAGVALGGATSAPGRVSE